MFSTNVRCSVFHWVATRGICLVNTVLHNRKEFTATFRSFNKECALH
jgi:hypothetical protein